LPTAFFANSLLSSGLQVADILAYCANERYIGRKGYIENIFQEFRKISFNYEDIDQNINIFGIQHIPKK